MCKDLIVRWLISSHKKESWHGFGIWVQVQRKSFDNTNTLTIFKNLKN